MALEFVNDAICLSGLTGSRLKCEVIGQYYPFWWNITSGGPRASFQWPTAIVELDAATGEVHIKDTKETLLGSSGHALDLKCCNPNTRNLKVVLVERDIECYNSLVHLDHLVNDRNDKEQTWTSCAYKPTKPQNHAAFPFIDDLDRAPND